MVIKILYGLGLLITGVFMSCALDILDPDDPIADPRMLPVDLADSLSAASPESQGFEPERLDRALLKADEISGLRSLVVLRNGRIVVDRNYPGTSAGDSLVNIRAATNLVTVALIGIAINEGLIKDEFAPLHQFMANDDAAVHFENRQLTLRHLLTMTTGWQWNESRGDFIAWTEADDQIDFLTQLNGLHEPGFTFNYNSGAAHLLSVALSKAAGVPTLTFAQQYLLQPLGITVHGWETDARGYYYGGHGLKLSAIDMAKIGQLFLQEGFSGTKSIVPQFWVNMATNAQIYMNMRHQGLKNINFGYLLYREDANFNSAFFVWGYGGQFIYCVPDRNLVIVTTANCSLPFELARQQGDRILELIARDLVGSVRPVAGREERN